MPTSLNKYLDRPALDETVVNIRQIEEALEEEMQDLPYARPDGLYPDMTVGAVIGADETAQWATRVCTVSGTAIVKSVKGATEVQNGALVPVRIAGIESTDTQDDELDSVEWPTFTLRGAGAAGDMLYPDHAETRVGVTTVTGANYWNAGSAAYNGDLATDRYVIINGAIPDGAAPHPINVRVTDFTTVSNPSVGIWDAPDSHVNECRMNGTQLHICFSNALVGITTDMTAAQRTEAIKTWLNAHPQEVWFELATPTTTPISPTLPTTYRVQAGGSESIIVPDGEVSAAPVLTIAEPVNAGDEFARIWAAIQSLGYTRNTAQLSRPVSLTDIGSMDEVQNDTTEIDTIKEVKE